MISRRRSIAEAPALERAERVVFGEDIDLLDHLDEDFLAAFGLEVEGDAALVGVEQHEVMRIDAGLFGQQPAALLAHFGRLDLDHVGAEPRQHLGARGAGFELREVENLYTSQRFFHG